MTAKEKDKTLVACPVKQTNAYRWVCTDKCSYTEAQCKAKMAEMKRETKHCIDCVHDGKKQPCKVCISADPDGRERPFWKFAGEITPEKPDISNSPSQMALF